MLVKEFIEKARKKQSQKLQNKLLSLTLVFLPAGWTYTDWFAFEERAAILEFDGGYSREESERLAKKELKLFN